MDHFVVRDDVGPHKVPSIGSAELLLIPVEVAGHPPIDRARLESFFSDANAEGFPQYFKVASLGRYAPRVTVAPTVHFESCPLPEADFPGCRIRRGDINALVSGTEMMREVLRRTDAQGVDFTRFDVNGLKGQADRWADGVMILANTPFGGIAFPIGYYNTGDNLAGGKGGALIVDGVRIPHLAIAGGTDVHVMVHEFGHLLGLTDLYDEYDTYEGLQYSFMGAWGYDPAIPLPDAETRYRLRWGRVHQVSGTERLVLEPVETGGGLIRLGTGEEYFLVENRGPGERFDRGLVARGLAVFHVDRTVKLRGEEGYFQSRSLDCVNCDPWHPYVRFVQADDAFHVEHGGSAVDLVDLFASGDALLPDPSGVPLSAEHKVSSTNFYSGEVSGIRIENIAVYEDGTIAADFTAPESDPCADPLCEEGVGCRPVSCKPARSEEAPEAGGCAAAGAGGLGLLFTAGLLSALRSRRRAQPFLNSDSAAES